MRCASCGTENAPDSRFCGGCGAKLAPSRVAPTAKITDDTPFPTQPPGVSYRPDPVSIPPGPSSRPPMSIPPHKAIPTPAPGSLQMPPSAARAPTPLADVTPLDSTANRPTPAREYDRRPIAVTPHTGSRSVVMPAKRPIGLMVFVILVDLALAGAGAWLLAKGLAEEEAKPTQKTQATTSPNVEARASNIETSSGAQISQPSADIAAPAPAAATETTKSTPKPVAEAPKQAAARPSATAPQPAPTTPPTTKQTTGSTTSPTTGPTTSPSGRGAEPDDPYVDVPFETQVDRHTAASKRAFERCATDAGDPRGSVKIAFRVLEDGTVANASPVEDSTGAAGLADCLARTISAWRFAPHSGAAINSLRAFNYP